AFHQSMQKSRQIVGDMIDRGVAAALQLPILAHDFPGAVRHDEYRGHAELVRDHEIARQILEHRGPGWINGMTSKELVVGLRRRLRLEFGCNDVEHRLEMFADAEPLEDRAGMV